MSAIFGIAYKSDTSGLKKAQSQFSKFADGLKSTLALAGVGLGAKELVSQLQEAAKAAVEDSKGQAMLANALRNTVGANTEQIASVEDSISKMQFQASVADDVIRPAFTALVSSTKDVASATDLMGVALDLAAYKGIDVQSAADALAKAHQGVTKSLFMMMPELKNSANYMQDLRDTTAGAADAAANADPFQQMTVVLQDLQEQLGYYLLPALKNLAAYIKSDSFRSMVSSAIAGFGKIVAAITNVGTALDNLITKLGGKSGVVGDALNSMFGDGNWIKSIPVIGGWIDILSKAKTGVEQFTNTSSAAAKNWRREYTPKKGGDGIDLHPLNPKPGQVYTFMNYADGADQPAVWWTQTWTGKTWTTAKRMTYTPKKDSAATAAARKAAADLKKRTQSFVDAVKLRVDTIKSLTGDLSSFVPESYANASRNIGQFESAVISASDSLKSNLQQALDNKGITQAAYENLLAYANREVAIMQKIAAQRDILVAKIEAAKATYLEVANAVRSYGNITSTTTQQVTESYTKWIDGVEVTISKTVDALQNKDLVANYKNIVDKTKTFVKNLSDIKKMGLNSTLFKQIVDAGVDAGGATAQAIVDGGQATVSSLNDLFGQLDSAGAQMADMTAQVMSDNGVTIVSAFIDGLTSQESALADTAKSMAQVFSDAWSNNVKFSIPQINASDYGLTKAQADAALADAGLPTDQGGTGKNDFAKTVADVLPPAIKNVVDNVVAAATTSSFSAWDAMASNTMANFTPVNTSASTGYASAGWSVAGLSSAATSMSNNAPTYNVTVNAGMGTDGSSVGQTIVQLLKQYERNNGAVWVSSV